MTTDRGNRATRYPLHVTIAFAFTALLLLVGVALITFNYYESRRVALLGADDLLERSSAHLQSSISGLYVPVQKLVDVSSRALSGGDATLEERLRMVDFLAEPFHQNLTVSAVFIGYPDGDLFLLRPLRGFPRAAEALSAPREAAFAVQSIERTDGSEPVESHLFFDDDLNLLERRTLEWSRFDPREREWYRKAIATDQIASSDFYIFRTTQQVGITFSRQLAGGGAVLGADLALSDLERGLARQRVTPSTKIAVLAGDGSIVALSERRGEVPRVARQDDDHDDEIEMPHVTDLDDPVYKELGALFASGVHSKRHELTVDGRTWLASLAKLPTRAAGDVVLAVLIPRDELLAGVIRVRNQSALISLVLLLAAVLLAIRVSRHVSSSLTSLAREADAVREFKLDTPITVRSRIREVDDLAATMSVMKSSIQQFLAISHALSAEKDYRRLLEMILAEARNVSGAEGGAILMRTDDDKALHVAILEKAGSNAGEVHPAGGERSPGPVDLEVDDSGGRPSVDRHVAEHGTIVRIDDIGADGRYEFAALRERFDGDGFESGALLSVPLRNQLDEVIGILQLVKGRAANGASSRFAAQIVPYIEALSSDAAVALDIRRLLKAQRDLLDSLILVIAGAIDAKSPYTHGHCQRVPEVARMLAAAAEASEHGPFARFKLTDDEWYELHLASWLHDCGKVTTPEYVVDKATKLETIYNRIHEIRTRFEVLWRDAQIDALRAVQEGRDESEVRERLERRQAALRDDFRFVAGCNLGDEPMSKDGIERLRHIAAQAWERHFDDSLGLSHLELELKGNGASPALPVIETLITDRPEHIITRPPGSGPFGAEPHDFIMDVPEHLYNRGEMHNLCIPRGTLTAEERFKINEHVIQTLRMLRQLPFPRELRRVPDWAANHHEKLDGTGYPRRLAAGDLSIPERIMAVADVFEALTATDRPYQAPRTLSKAIGIMTSMCAGGHLCPDLFTLFLESGVYLHYSKRNLTPEQIDEVDVAGVVESLRAKRHVGTARRV